MSEEEQATTETEIEGDGVYETHFEIRQFEDNNGHVVIAHVYEGGTVDYDPDNPAQGKTLFFGCGQIEGKAEIKGLPIPPGQPAPVLRGQHAFEFPIEKDELGLAVQSVRSAFLNFKLAFEQFLPTATEQLTQRLKADISEKMQQARQMQQQQQGPTIALATALPKDMPKPPPGVRMGRGRRG